MFVRDSVPTIYEICLSLSGGKYCNITIDDERSRPRDFRAGSESDSRLSDFPSDSDLASSPFYFREFRSNSPELGFNFQEL